MPSALLQVGQHRRPRGINLPAQVFDAGPIDIEMIGVELAVQIVDAGCNGSAIGSDTIQPTS
jgi:hypothetical protein